MKQGWTLGLLGSAPVEPILAALDGSVTQTIGKYECGLWDQTSPIVVVTKNQTHLEQLVQNRFFRRHPSFKIVSSSSHKGFIVQSQYNIWEYSCSQSMKEVTDKQKFWILTLLVPEGGRSAPPFGKSRRRPPYGPKCALILLDFS